MPLLLHSCLPNHFTYPQNRNLALLCTDIAGCWLRKEYSILVIITKMEQVVTHRIAILFQLVYSLLFTDQSNSVYQTTAGIRSPQWSLRTKLLTISNKLWKKHDLTLQPVITYIYLCERLAAVCLSSFSNRPVMDQKLNWNVTQALEKPFTTGIL
jgi:hypothetical protein